MTWAFIQLILHVEVKGQKITLPLRTTMIFQHNNDTWYLKHSHSSQPSDHQGIDSSYPTIEGIENTIKYWVQKFEIGSIEIDVEKGEDLIHYLNLANVVVRQITNKEE